MRRYNKFPLVVLLGSPNPFSSEIVKHLIKSSCRVQIISDEFFAWKILLKRNIKEKDRVQIKRRVNIEQLAINYVICSCYASLSKEDRQLQELFRKRMELTKKLTEKHKPKTVFLFHRRQTKSLYGRVLRQIRRMVKNGSKCYAFLLIGDVIFSQASRSERFELQTALQRSVSDSLLRIDSSTSYYPVEVGEVVKEIIRALFSLSAYGKVLSILSKPMGANSFEKIFRSSGVSVNIARVKSKKRGYFIKPDKIITINDNVEQKLVDILDGFKKTQSNKFKSLFHRLQTPYHSGAGQANIPALGPGRMSLRKGKLRIQTKNSTKNVGGRKGKLDRSSPSYYKSLFRNWKTRLLTALILFIIFPFMATFFNFFLLKTSRITLNSSDLVVSRALLNVSNVLARTTINSSYIHTHIPVVSNYYETTIELSEMFREISVTGLEGVSIIENFAMLLDSIVDGRNYDLDGLIEEINLDLGLFYSQLGFIQADITQLGEFEEEVLINLKGQLDVSLLRKRVILLRKVMEEYENILGVGSPKTYLVLFQNNTSLQATGGLIDSYALVSISDGRLDGIEIFDTAYVDNRLQGVVEPPIAIRKYMESENWYLRNSNWNPDFPSSALKAEWFLDKAVDSSVDGVIATDLDFLKLIVDRTGRFGLSKNNFSVDFENLYQLANEAATGSDYPEGKGDDRYTNLIKEFSSMVTKNREVDGINLIVSLLEGFNNKSLQIFVHNKSLQKIFSELGWDGGVNELACLGNCYSDFVGLVESNMGTGNSHLILMKLELSVVVEEGIIKRQLKIVVENPTDDDYRTYYRLLAKADSGFGKVSVISKEVEREYEPEIYGTREFKEAGIFVNLAPKEEKTLTFNWESGFDASVDQSGEYLLLLRKQPGAGNRSAEVEISIDKATNLVAKPSPALTNGAIYRYNTSLSRDFISRIFWEKNE